MLQFLSQLLGRKNYQMASEEQTKRRDSTDGDLPPVEILFGTSPAMQAVRQTAEKVAGTTVPILILGDGGTGKEMLARWIHKNSPNADGEFVKISCAAIPSQLLESELFGYEKGAFTGANHSKPGRVERAEKGTLFLQGISELVPRLQVKLLHFLQDGAYCRLGDDTERRVNARVICASSKDLEQRIKTREFRADLFYRINVVQLRLPRLQDRREDIPSMAEYLRLEHEKRHGVRSEPFRSEILSYFKTLSWQGNLRELSNRVARYTLLGPESSPSPLAPTSPVSASATTTSSEATLPLRRIARDAVRKMERDLILQALRENQWNRRKAAEALQISYRSLIYKIRESGLVNGSDTF